jgi:hypothetical protein
MRYYVLGLVTGWAVSELRRLFREWEERRLEPYVRCSSFPVYVFRSIARPLGRWGRFLVNLACWRRCQDCGKILPGDAHTATLGGRQCGVCYWKVRLLEARKEPL